MLRVIRRIWANYVASIPKSEVADSIPESQWGCADLLPAVSKAKRKAFTDLLSLIFLYLPPEEAEAMVKAKAAVLTRGDDVDTALLNALFPEEGQEPATGRGFIACDWKAVEEVQWQAEQLCANHRISGHWQAPAGTIEEVLQNFDKWLQQQEHRLLCFSPGDSVVAFALLKDHAASAIALGKRLGLSLNTPSDA